MSMFVIGLALVTLGVFATWIVTSAPWRAAATATLIGGVFIVAFRHPSTTRVEESEKRRRALCGEVAMQLESWDGARSLAPTSGHLDEWLTIKRTTREVRYYCVRDAASCDALAVSPTRPGFSADVKTIADALRTGSGCK